MLLFCRIEQVSKLNMNKFSIDCRNQLWWFGHFERRESEHPISIRLLKDDVHHDGLGKKHRRVAQKTRVAPRRRTGQRPLALVNSAMPLQTQSTGTTAEMMIVMNCNMTRTSNVGAISKAQKGQRF